MGGPSNGRMPAKKRKIQILANAVKVFARSNYQSARMKDIAEASGVSEAAVYKYFRSKKDIFLSIIGHTPVRALKFIERDRADHEDAIEALIAISLHFYRRMVAHPDENRIHLQAISEVGDEDVAQVLRRSQSGYMEVLARIARQGQARGQVRPDVDADALAVLINGLGNVSVIMEMLKLDEWFDEEVFRSILEMIMESVRVEERRPGQ